MTPASRSSTRSGASRISGRSCSPCAPGSGSRTSPDENRSPRTDRVGRYYASPQTRRNVELAYAKDFEAFGYSP